MKLLLSLAILPFIPAIAIAGKPVPLDDVQMDQVTAGLTITEDIPFLFAGDRIIINITIVGGSFGEIPAGSITAGFLSLPAQSISIPSMTTTVTSTLP